MRRAAVVVLSALLVAAGCGREATSRRRDARATRAPSADAAPRGGDSASASPDGGAGETASPEEPPPPRTGLVGRIQSVEEAPAATVLAFRPGDKAPTWRGLADGSGRFNAPELPPGTYRLIVPGDGVHATADLYGTVAPADAGPATEVVVHRSKGCPVRATFRQGEPDAGGPPIVGAEVEMRMPDLDQVGDARVVLRGTTDEEGSVTVVGTCVRGAIEGTLRPRGGAPMEFRHGYLGGGRDRFEISFPEEGTDGGAGHGGGAR